MAPSLPYARGQQQAHGAGLVGQPADGKHPCSPLQVPEARIIERQPNRLDRWQHFLQPVGVMACHTLKELWLSDNMHAGRKSAPRAVTEAAEHVLAFASY